MRLSFHPLAAGLGLVLASCGAEPDRTANDVGYEIAAKDQVKAKLRDPDSAVFTAVKVVRRNDTVAICGYVNSRNALGGMTGPQRFIAGGAVGLEEDFAPGEMDQAWTLLC